MKKKITLYAITLVIAGLMITSMSAMASFRTMDTNSAEIENSIPFEIVERDDTIHTFSMPMQTIDVNPKHVARPLDTQITGGPEDEKHAGLGRNIGGEIVTAWEQPDLDEVLWTFSADDGATFDPGVYWDLEGMSTYPAVDYWGQDSRFFGTMVPSYEFLVGAPTVLMECTDVTNYDTWTLSYWDWSSNGWEDMLDVDIAADNSQADWQFGMLSLVSSTSYGDGVTDGPFIFYTTDDAGYATISWYYVDGCAHTTADIDHVTSKTYAAYDYYNQEDVNDTKWTLLVRKDDFSNWAASGNLYEISADGNITSPAIAAYDNNVLIAAEYDGGVYCFYDDRGMAGAVSNVLIEEGATNPRISHAKNEIFVISYVKDGDLWMTITEDAGATWSTAEQINDNDGSVVAEYKTSDLAEKGSKAMWGDDRNENIDIYLNDGYELIEAAIQIADVSGGFGISAVIENVGNGDDSDVEWTITFEEGEGLIIIPSGRVKAGVEPTITAGGLVTVKTGLIFGFGMVSITVEATGTENTATASASGFVLGPFALGVG